MAGAWPIRRLTEPAVHALLCSGESHFSRSVAGVLCENKQSWLKLSQLCLVTRLSSATAIGSGNSPGTDEQYLVEDLAGLLDDFRDLLGSQVAGFQRLIDLQLAPHPHHDSHFAVLGNLV